MTTKCDNMVFVGQGRETSTGWPYGVDVDRKCPWPRGKVPQALYNSRTGPPSSTSKRVNAYELRPKAAKG